MPPEGKTPRHKADFPLGNVKLYYQSKKPFISKSFPSRALDPKGSLLYFCRSHFLWPQKGAGRQLSVFPSACSELEVPALCPSTTPLLPGHCWGRDSPSLQCQEGSRSQGQEPWGLPCSPESSSAPARLHEPLLSRERGTEGQKVPIPQQEPTGQVHSLVSDLFLLRCSKPGVLPFPAQAVSTAPRWGQLGGATRHSREKPGELLVPLVPW